MNEREELLADIEDIEDRIEQLKDQHADMLRQLSKMDSQDDREPCEYCGIRMDNPCDSPPVDVCEKAITYNQRHLLLVRDHET